MEHRCGYRRSTQLPVTLRTLQGLSAAGRVLDLSASGALVSCSLPVRVNTQLLVQFHYSGALQLPIWTIRADVIRTVRNGFALEWEDFSSPTIRAILQQVAPSAEAAALVV